MGIHMRNSHFIWDDFYLLCFVEKYNAVILQQITLRIAN